MIEDCSDESEATEGLLRPANGCRLDREDEERTDGGQAEYPLETPRPAQRRERWCFSAVQERSGRADGGYMRSAIWGGGPAVPGGQWNKPYACQGRYLVSLALLTDG